MRNSHKNPVSRSRKQVSCIHLPSDITQHLDIGYGKHDIQHGIQRSECFHHRAQRTREREHIYYREHSHHATDDGCNQDAALQATAYLLIGTRKTRIALPPDWEPV